MIDPVTRQFEIAQYDDKIVISITRLAGNIWISGYPIPIEIRYDQVSEFIGHEFIKPLIEYEYRITAKQRIQGNPMSNAAL